jgi:tRNA modification GTPase
MTSRQEIGPLVRAVLVGQPNSGKSSLFNALACGAGALVSDQPGTTRDYLTAELDLEGVHCQLVDTGGIEEQPETELARAAQAVSHEQHRSADVRIFCVDSTGSGAEFFATLSGPFPSLDSRAETILILTKTDLPRNATGGAVWQKLSSTCPPLETSSRSGAGLDALRARLRQAILARRAGEGEVVAGTAARCRQSLALAAEGLARARELVFDQAGEELVAAEVRTALEEIGKVAGVVYTDDVLDRIFSRFCIGK